MTGDSRQFLQMPWWGLGVVMMMAISIQKMMSGGRPRRGGPSLDLDQKTHPSNYSGVPAYLLSG